jgi:hypothetical protein
LKKASGSNESLIDFDASGELTMLGLPVITHPGVDAATMFWGIPKGRIVTVLREDAEVNRSKDSGFYKRRARCTRNHPSRLRIPARGFGDSRLRRILIYCATAQFTYLDGGRPNSSWPASWP